LEKCREITNKTKEAKNKKRHTSKVLKSGKISSFIQTLLKLLKYKKRINQPESKLRHYKQPPTMIEKNSII